MSNNSEIINEEECEEEQWEELKADNNYEININYPYQIRKKTTGRIIKESKNKDGYLICHLTSSKIYRKHRLIAQQWISNPDNLSQVDHINRDRTDNHIENLRWVSHSENNKNKSSNNNVIYEYVEKIDDEAIEITDYGNYHFEFYYYVENEDSFYFYNGVQYRKLHINILKSNGLAFVCMNDTNNKRRFICLNKFKKLYGIEF